MANYRCAPSPSNCVGPCSWSHIKYVRFFENKNYFFIFQIEKLWAANWLRRKRPELHRIARRHSANRFLMCRTTREPAKQDEWSGGKSCVQVPSCSVHNLPEKKESIFLKPIFSAFFFWMQNTTFMIQRMRNRDHCEFWFFFAVCHWQLVIHLLRWVYVEKAEMLL